MELSQAQYEEIARCMPRQRGKVSLSDSSVLNAIPVCSRARLQLAGLSQLSGSCQVPKHLDQRMYSTSLSFRPRPLSAIDPPNDFTNLLRRSV